MKVLCMIHFKTQPLCRRRLVSGHTGVLSSVGTRCPSTMRRRSHLPSRASLAQTTFPSRRCLDPVTIIHHCFKKFTFCSCVQRGDGMPDFCNGETFWLSVDTFWVPARRYWLRTPNVCCSLLVVGIPAQDA